MSDHRSGETLPGLSAAAWQRIVGVGITVLVLILVVLGVIATAAGFPFGAPLGVLAGVGAVAGVAAVIRTRGYPRERAELRAGYTTRSGVHAEVTQREPGSGRILRLPGQAPLARRYLERGVDSVVDTAPPLLGRARRVILQLLTTSITLGVLPALRPHARWWTFPLIAGILILIFGTTLGIVSVARIGRLRALAAVTGDAVRFTATRPQDVLLGLYRAGMVAPVIRPRTPLALSASRQGHTVWMGRPFEQVAAIPWPAVARIEVGVIGGKRTSRTETGLTVWVGNRWTPVPIPLANPNAHLWGVVSTVETEWIRAALEEQRGTQAVVL